MFVKLLVGLTLVACVFSKAVQYKDCGSVSGKINSLDLSPCTSDPCVLTAGNNYTATVNYTALANSSTAKTVVYGVIGGVPVPFPVPSDACNNKNIQCPIVQGFTGLYENSIYCSPAYPKIKLIVKWEVKDDDQKDLFCFEAPLVIN